MVFQSFNLLPTLTALENVELPLHVPGGIRRPSSSAEKLLSEVGLRHRLHHRPAQLSGGEQQRVAVARALITEPAIIVADEPTGNLDTSTGDELITLLLDLRTRRGTTLLVATHDNDLAVRADRILRVRDGRLTVCSATSGFCCATQGDRCGGVGDGQRWRCSASPSVLLRWWPCRWLRRR
jgi:putative ABC transport system ATP-binding protein